MDLDPMPMSTLRRIGRVVLAALALLGELGTAHAQGAAETPELTLRWMAPKECPTEAAVLADIERLLGRALQPASDRPLAARADVDRGDAGWRLTLDVAEAGANARQRTLDGDNCRQLAQAAAVIIALAIDPNLEIEADQPPSAAFPETPPTTSSGAVSTNGTSTGEPANADATSPAAPTAPTPKTQPPPPPSSSAAATSTGANAEPENTIRWRFSAVGLVDGWSLPKAAPGLGLGGGLEWQVLRVEAFGFHFFPQRSDELRGGGNGLVRLTGGGVHACADYRAPPVAVGPCLSTEVGAMFASTSDQDVDDGGSGTAVWWAVGAGAFGSVVLSEPWALVMGVEMLAPLLRDRFVVSLTNELVHQPPEWTARGQLGLAFRFP